MCYVPNGLGDEPPFDPKPEHMFGQWEPDRDFDGDEFIEFPAPLTGKHFCDGPEFNDTARITGSVNYWNGGWMKFYGFIVKLDNYFDEIEIDIAAVCHVQGDDIRFTWRFGHGDDTTKLVDNWTLLDIEAGVRKHITEMKKDENPITT